jgi:hypothetical protein
MASFAGWLNLLWWCVSAATLVLLIRLWREGLVSTYRYFFAYLAWDLFSQVTLHFVDRRTTRYAIVYFCFQGVIWVLYIITSLELTSSVFRRFPGVTTLGRSVLSVSLAIGIGSSLVSMAFGVNYPPAAAPVTVVMMNLFLLGRIVCLSVLVFLLTSSAFLLWFPVPLPANATRFLLGYTACFAARTTGLFMLNQQGFAWSRMASVVSLGVILGCLVYWILRLSRQGEVTDIVVGQRSDPEREQRALSQLEAINSRVSDTIRK